MASGRTLPGGQNTGAASSANNKQAQLVNAYQELGKELGSDRLKTVGGYTLGRVIGEGTFGSVHLATHRLTGTRCAIKKIPKSATAHLTREIHHHRRLHHPHIVHLHEILATETHVWLVSELCSGGELFDYLVERGRIPEGEARRIFGELAVAVGTMHIEGVVHRDLKLENVLLDGELRVKLGDLGFAREWQRGKLMETFCGTTGYASPEMLAGRKYLGVETDIWSLGIILYTLLCGGLPFDDDDERVMKDLIAKGEYEEPEWLSSDARDLIKSLLQQDPARRPSVETMLTHPWFKSTIVDNLHPEGSLPSTPHLGTPHSEHKGYFAEPFRGDPGPSSLRSLAPQPSPLSQQTATIPESSSEASDASFVVDSDGKPASVATTPPTDDEAGDLKRNHSGEFSHTERVLELLHPNASQSTIRRSGSESPGNIGPSSMRATKPNAVLANLDEEAISEERVSATEAAHVDEHALHLPVAQHSRTPSRTKRRSVSSTLSIERRHSHHSTSGQWQTHVPEDYLSQLNAPHPMPFSTASEKHLLNMLSDLGFDTGQLMHSITNDACDASAATWWILRQKQLERGETDEVINARHASAARKRERAAAYVREERQRNRTRTSSPDQPRHGSVTFQDEPTSIPPTMNIIDLGAPLTATPTALPASPEPISASISSHDLPTIVEGKLAPPAVGSIRHPAPQPQPQTPPRESRTTSLEASPSAAKNRSPSMTMLQRATSALVGKPKDEEPRRDERSTSPTKLHKQPPKSKTPQSDSDPQLSLSLHSPEKPREPQHSPELPASSTLSALPPGPRLESPSSISSAKRGVKRESLWTTFRHLFQDERRRRKSQGSPSAEETKVVPTVVLSRGIAARNLHPTRLNQPAPSSRRTSLEGGRPPMYSRRSSSVNSRRSSFNSAHVEEGAGLKRRHSTRSHGSQTPTSDLEVVHPPSRPSSIRSDHRRSGSGLAMRSPSMQSDSSGRLPASPLHNYHRRPPQGTASTRVRHIRVIPESQILRSSSVASSIRSATSSRASSVDGRRDDGSDYDSRDDASSRSRRKSERRGAGSRSNSSLAAQIHRRGSPALQDRRKNETDTLTKKLRDVFKDEEWIDEEEYQGGLGQVSSSGAQANRGRMLAATYPGRGKSATKASKEETGHRRRGSNESASGSEAESKESHKASGNGGGGTGPRRRGLPERKTGKAPLTIAEEEEEDE